MHFDRTTSALATGNGVLFNTDKKIFVFGPSSVHGDDCIPPVIFSGLAMTGRSIIPKRRSLLRTSVSSARRLILSRSRGVFSMRFTTLSCAGPRGIRCTCVLSKFRGR